MQLLWICAGAEEGEWGQGLLRWVVAEPLCTGVLQRPSPQLPLLSLLPDPLVSPCLRTSLARNSLLIK